jgi:hypothetical protein
MNVFLRRRRIPQPYGAWIDSLVAEQQGRRYRWYAFDKKDSEASRRILEASEEEQLGFVLAAAEWLDLRHRKQSAAFYETWAVRQPMLSVLRRRLPFDHDEVCRLLNWSIRQPYTSVRGTPQMIKVLQDHLKEHELTPDLRKRVTKLTKRLEEGHSTEETRRWAARLRELGGFRLRHFPSYPAKHGRMLRRATSRRWKAMSVRPGSISCNGAPGPEARSSAKSGTEMLKRSWRRSDAPPSREPSCAGFSW